tara:strand:- start:431 stop:1348 length:918 start_codon:yes stop_codon:yes gene_type:complete
MNILDIPFLELNIGADIDADKLKSELKVIEEKYGLAPPSHSDYMSYVAPRWLEGRIRKLALKAILTFYNTFVPVVLVSFSSKNKSKLNRSIGFGDKNKDRKFSELKSVAPYMFSVIEKIYGNSPKSRIQIARLKPKRSLIWHSHKAEEQGGWDINNLIIQIPICCPEGVKYYVFNKNEWGERKRFNKPSRFKTIKEKEFKEGKAYYFNGYHYHNVYNTSNKPRTVILFQVNARYDDIRKLFKKSLQNKSDIIPQIDKEQKYILDHVVEYFKLMLMALKEVFRLINHIPLSAFDLVKKIINNIKNK